MAQNDALTFYVSFMEDQNNTINKLVGELAKQLKSMVVHLDSKNIDVSGLKAEIGKLEGAKVVDQKNLTETENHIKSIAELLGKAFNGKNGGEQFTGMLRAIVQVREEIGKVSAEMGKMSIAISNLGSGISANIGNAIVNNMTQIVEATGRAISKVQELNELAGKNLGGKRAHKEEEKIIPPTLGLSSTNFKSEAEQIMKTYEDVEKRMQQKIKSIQDTIAKFPKDTFIKNPANREWMKQEMDDVERLQRHLLSLLGVIEKFSSVQTPNRIIKFDEPVKQMTAEERNARQWMYNSLFNSREAIAMQNSVDTAGMEKARTKAAEIREQMDKINEAIARTNDQNLIQGATAAHQRLEKIHSELESISKTGGSSGGKSYAEYSKATDIKEAVSQGDKAVKDINTAIEKAHKASEELKRKQIKSNKDAADAELQRLRKIMRDLNSIQAKSPKLQIEGMDKAKQELQTLIELLQRAKKEGTSISGIDFGRSGYSTASETLAGLSRNQQMAEQTAEQHAQAQQRMEQAIASATGKAQQQSQVLSDLRSMAAQYVSAWGAWNFAKEVANITGELQLQQKSLEVIIGSSGQAQEMFNNIKGLSQMSPYTFQDMLKSTRQLAAFGVETKNLYGTMKSLSDLGAGLDVDVQRLILAYGHVKSAGVLSGIQRRQFETAGIGITGELAKLYNERYARAGSDERVTPADVFKKITKREVTFDDVQDVIKRLTGPGGQFYEMQLRQFDTLGGKLRNLKNNYNIMLDEIGKSYMNLLTGTVDTFNSMMENWRTWGKLIKSVTLALVAAKAANIAFGKSWSAHRAAALSQYRATMEARQIVAVNAGTSGKYFPRVGSVGRQQLAMPYANAINNSDMSRYQKIRSALYGNVTKEARNAILSQQKLGEAYKHHISRLQTMANSTKTVTRAYGQFGLAMERLKWSARGFFNTMRVGIASLLANPLVWIGAITAAISTLSQKASEIREIRDRAIKNAMDTTKADISSIDSVLNPIKTKATDKDTGLINVAKLDTQEVQSMMQDLDEALQKFDPLYKGHIFSEKLMQDEEQRVLDMMENLSAAREGKEYYRKSANGIFQADAESGYEGFHWNNPNTYGRWNTATEEMKAFEDEYVSLTSKIKSHGDAFDALAEYNGKVWESTAELSNWIRQSKQIYGDSYTSADAVEEWIKQGGSLNKNRLGKDLERISREQEENEGIKIDVSQLVDLDTHELDKKRRNVISKLSGVIASINNTVKDMSKAGISVKGQASYIMEAINGLLSTDGHELSNPAVHEMIMNFVIATMTPDDDATEAIKQEYRDYREAAISELYTTMANAKMSEMIEGMVQSGELSSDATPEDFEAKAKDKWNRIVEAVQNQAPTKEAKGLVSRIFNDFFRGIKADPQPAIDEMGKAWMLVYKKAKDKELQDFYIKNRTIFDTATDDSDMWDKIDKKMKENREKISKLAQRYTVFHSLRFKIDAAWDVKSLTALRDTVKKMLDKLPNDSLMGGMRAVYKEMYDALNEMVINYAAANKRGVNLENEGREKHQQKVQKAADKSARDRDKKKHDRERAAERAKSEEERKAKEAEQKEIEMFRNRIRLLNDYRRRYKELRSEMTKYEALQQVISEYTNEFGKNGPLKISDFDSLEDFRSLLKEYSKLVDASKIIRDKEKKIKLKEEINNASNAVAQQLFKESSEKQLANISTKLDDITRKWETFNKVLDKTGDEELASRLSGMSRLLGTSNLWAAYHTGSALENIDLGFISAVDWKKVAMSSDKDLEEYAVNILGKRGTADKVKALIEVFKNVKRAYNDLEKEIVNAINTATSDAVDFVSVEKRLEQGLYKITSLITASEDLSSEEKALLTNRERAKTRHEEFTKSNEYARFESNAEGMSPAEFNSIYEKIRKDLLSLLDNRLITVDDFAKKIKDLRNKRSEYEIKQFSKITDLTLDSRLERNLTKALADYQKKVAAYEKANAEYEDTQIEYKRLTNIETQVVNKRKEAKALRDDAFWAKNRGEITKAELLTQKADRLEAEADALNIEAENAKAEIKTLKLKLPGLKAARDDAKEAADEAGEEVKKRQGQKDNEDKSKATVSNVINALNKFKEALDFVSGILDSFGLDAAFTEDTSSVIGGMVNGATTVDGIAKAFGAAGPWGAVAGAALGLAGQLSQIHDKSLQRRIDEIKEDTTKMNNTLESIRSLRERQLGYDSGDLRRALAAQYGVQNGLTTSSSSLEDMLTWIAGFAMKPSGSADSAMREYYTRYSKGSGYEQELELLKGQREKIMEMYDLEDKKKKKSKEELENYKQQIAALDEQIMFFTEDLANNLWGIDLKGWADQLGDALMTAFENGTSAASAFKDSVQDIMRDVVKNMLTVGVIEPALEKLRVRLFGKDGNGGVFKGSQENIGAVLSELGNWFENEGPALMDAANEFYNGADNMMRQILGYGMRESEKSTNTVNSITSTASEETMGVVAGYLSRLSQDVSVQRIMQEMFVNGSWPDYVEQVTSANDSLSAIDRSTTAMMEMMRDGNGALYERVENMSRRLDNFANGIDTITMR